MKATAASLLLGLALAVPAAHAQTVAPALADGWTFMQAQMKGVPYALLEAACGEKALMIYHGTWTDAQEAQVKAFNRRFPCVAVKLFELNATPLRTRFQAESRAGQRIVDIVQDTDPGTLDEEAGQGLFLSYKISSDAAYADAVKKTGFWYPLRIALEGIAWNMDVVKPEEAALLNDWKSVADPRWKGRAGVADPASGGVNYLPWYAWTRLYGADFIAKVGAIQPRVFNASNPSAAALASGDIAVLLNASETGLLPLWLAGAPIRWSLPEPGVGPVTGQAISALAPHPNAAKLYQEYAFSEEGYGVWQKLGGAPARLGFKDQREVASQPWYKYPTRFLDYETKHASAQNPRILQEFRKVVGAPR